MIAKKHAILRKKINGEAVYLLGQWRYNIKPNRLYCTDPNPTIMSMITTKSGKYAETTLITGGILPSFPSNGSIPILTRFLRPSVRDVIKALEKEVYSSFLRIKTQHEFKSSYGANWRQGLSESWDECYSPDFFGKDTMVCSQEIMTSCSGTRVVPLCFDMLTFEGYSTDNEYIEKQNRLRSLFSLSEEDSTSFRSWLKETQEHFNPKPDELNVLKQLTNSQSTNKPIYEIFRKTQPITRTATRKVHTIFGSNSRAAIKVGHLSNTTISG